MKITWWKTPLALAAGGLATVTLSACYGPACVSTITKPDGSTVDGYSCGGDYDCRNPLPDGGAHENDSTWVMNCGTVDAGNTNDAGNTGDAGNPDAGNTGDAGNPDGGP
jgi:hypothetical protein